MESSGNEAKAPTSKKKWSFKKKALLTGMIVLGMSGVASAMGDGGQQQNQQSAGQTKPIQDAESAPKIMTRRTAESESLPFRTISQDDASLPSGQTQVAQEGKDGSKITTYEFTYADNVQTDKRQIGDPVVVNPVDKIVKNGTYVAPPSKPSVPSGASAMCNDGTYSYSAHRQGTCSHHGGVAVWY